MACRTPLLMLLLPLLATCSAYHPLTNGTGFKDEPVGETEYRVTYQAREEMSVKEAWQYALLRAAEVTVLRHAAYFQIDQAQIELAPRLHYRPAINRTFSEPMLTSNFGTAAPVVTRLEMPEYVRTFWVPAVTLQVRVSTEASEKGIPATYLLRRAMAERIKLSPEVAKCMAGLPEVKEPVYIPPAPAPTTKPAEP